MAVISTNMLAVDWTFAESATAATSSTYVDAPPPRQETITVGPPSAQAVWVPGSWERTPDEWVWTNGRWVMPPFRRAYWAVGYWQHVGGQYQWLPGHWAVGNQGSVVTQKIAPPAPLVEVKPAAPVGLNRPVWAPGHWEWRGTWIWIPGQYIVTNNPQAVWVQGEWDAVADGTWRWNPAHWAVK